MSTKLARFYRTAKHLCQKAKDLIFLNPKLLKIPLIEGFFLRNQMFLGLAAVILFTLIFNILSFKQGTGASFIPSEQNFEDWSGQGGAVLDESEAFIETEAEGLENTPPGPYTGEFSNYSEFGALPPQTKDSEIAFLEGDSLINVLSPFDFKPSNRQEIITYIVKEGDNPWAIAASFGISVETILWANNLKETTVINPGDKLEILPLNGVKHKIKSGENLSALIKKYKGDLAATLEINKLSENSTLEAGKTIVIANGRMPSLPAAAPSKLKPPIQVANLAGAGYFAYPTSGRNWGKIHGYNGIDISNSCGAPIYASAPGRVIESDASGWNGGYGKVIKILHPNGIVTLYAHNSQLLVSYDQEVLKGQLIAYMGSTGRSTGCHLHFEVRGARNPLAR